MADFAANNLFVLLAGLLVFTMTPSVGLLELGELGEDFEESSLLKVMLIAGVGLVVMAIVGFNTAFAPTVANGLIGNPLYGAGLFLGASSANAAGLVSGVFWSMTPEYFGAGLTTGTYFLFETAFALVTLALVGVVVLKKVKLQAFALFSVLYLVVIWNLPAAWVWNPTGWLYAMGVRDFAGGLVVHGAAGVAGLAILVEVWLEERKSGLKESPQVPISVNPTRLTLSTLLLWVGWFGFNAGSVLAFNSSAIVVVITTFLAAASGLVSLVLVTYWRLKHSPGLFVMANGVLMGLIVITPLAGFVSPLSAIVLGLLSGPLFYASEIFFGKRNWFTDPIGLLAGHFTGGIFGVLMIGFFTQGAFAAASGTAGLPNGILFGGGLDALHQLGIEAFGTVVVLAVAFALSFVAIRLASAAFHGLLPSNAAH